MSPERISVGEEGEGHSRRGTKDISVHFVSLNYIFFSSFFFFQCRFTSTETMKTIREREPRTSTSTFTQLLSKVNILLNVHRSKDAY